MSTSSIAILGAGSWGTAVAIHLARHGQEVWLWGHDAKHVAAMAQSGCNQRHLPETPFPEHLRVTADLALCQKQAEHLVIAVPSHAFLQLLSRLDKPKHGLCWLTKGVDPSSRRLLSELVIERFGKAFAWAMLSGPSFAKEVARGLPTAVTLAGNQKAYQKSLQHIFHQGNLRVYLNFDPIGVQLCGAVKNVLAIACGISDGLQFGANAKAAIITRGLAEMRRLGLAMGAEEDTFMGLAGLGDLVLTCTDDQSRNRRFGLLLGQGMPIPDAEQSIGQVVEGKHNAEQVCQLAVQHRVAMPICHEILRLLQGHSTAQKAVEALMSRHVGSESS